MIEPKHILIARTDSIGDVVLTLPVATMLKQQFPECKISFLGQSYTKPVLSCCGSIDEILEWNQIKSLPEQQQTTLLKEKNIDTVIHVFPVKEIVRICKKAGIKNRIATSHRLYTLITCNYRINFDRKKSDLHESQLNFKLLAPFGITEIPALDHMKELFAWHVEEKEFSVADKNKFNLILHPRSKGSAREWGLEKYKKLIQLLPPDKFAVFISGTSEEGKQLESFLRSVSQFPNVKDVTGKFSLAEFIQFIAQADGLLAASTGPLHIAAVSGIHAFGIFPPIRPMHPGRWQPIGRLVEVFVKNETCNDCRKTQLCHCIQEITPELIAGELIKLV